MIHRYNRPARATAKGALFLCALSLASCAGLPPIRHVRATEQAISALKEGSYKAASFLYASERNPRRPEYYAPAVRTPTFDVSEYIKSVNKDYWGYDAKAVPLNGKVWYPEDGQGPFPLIVFVHGNHAPRDPSEFGYDYLGRALASRGYIFASIDENFLNGSGGGENDARAIMLLEHARLIRSWADRADTPLKGKIDLSGLLVGGHSRGGEAAVLASLFNSVTTYPDNYRIPLNYNLPVKGVISVAPVEGQYRPSGRKTAPDGVDYLVMHGAMDGDVDTYQGLAFYNRANPGPGNFKVSLWLDKANHAQFNESWSKDQDPNPVFRSDLLVPEEQRRLASLAITAFANASLKDNQAAQKLLLDPAALAAAADNPVLYIQATHGSYPAIANFEDDHDLATASRQDWTVRLQDFTKAGEREQKLIPDSGLQRLLYKISATRNAISTWNLYLSAKPSEKASDKPSDKTDTPASPTLSISGPAIQDAMALRLDLATLRWQPKDEDASIIALTLEDGSKLTLPLANVYKPCPHIKRFVVMTGALDRIVFETLRVPLSLFPGYQGQGIQGVEIRFDPATDFELMLDNLCYEGVQP